MRVCVVTLTSEWGGAEIHTIALVRTLIARGHEVTIYQLGHDVSGQVRFDPESGVQIACIEIPQPANSLQFRNWLRLFRTLEGSFCIMPKGTFETGNWRFDLAARFHFARFITIEHLACPAMPPKSSRRHLGGLLPGIGIWWYRTLLPRYLRSLGPQRVICVSDAVRKQLAQDCAFPLRKMVTVHNGVDPHVFHFSRESRRKLRAAWGIPQTALVFGSVGRFNPQKAYALSLAAFQQLGLDSLKQDTHLVLVGDGPSRQELTNIAHAAKLNGRIHLLDFTDRPWEAYSAFDIFLLPSLNEGLPLALLEAMACGCCPIATSVGGVPEVLTDSSLGWLVAPNDIPSLLAAMRAASLTPPETRTEMGRRAREHVMTRFNAQVQYSTLADVLEQYWNRRTHRGWPWSSKSSRGHTGTILSPLLMLAGLAFAG